MNGNYNEDTNIGTQMRVIPYTLHEIRSAKSYKKRSLAAKRMERKRIERQLEFEQNPARLLRLRERKDLLDLELNLSKRHRHIPPSTLCMRYNIEKQLLTLQFDYEERMHNGRLVY